MVGLDPPVAVHAEDGGGSGPGCPNVLLQKLLITRRAVPSDSPSVAERASATAS